MIRGVLVSHYDFALGVFELESRYCACISVLHVHSRFVIIIRIPPRATEPGHINPTISVAVLQTFCQLSSALAPMAHPFQLGETVWYEDGEGRLSQFVVYACMVGHKYLLSTSVLPYFFPASVDHVAVIPFLRA